jgi:SET domain-containing protein
MSVDSGGIKPEAVDTALGEMKLEEGSDEGKHSQVPDLNGVRNSASATPKSSRSPTPANMEGSTQTPKSEEELLEDNIDEDVMALPEPGKVPKLSRKASQKIASRPPPLFDDLPDSTEEATSKFQVIRDCLYGSKYMGSSEHEALGCDCSEEWRKLTPNRGVTSGGLTLGAGDGQNHACGEDSDCINRATKMECVDDECNCGAGCQNQRFQRKQFAKVSVIKTEKKGYGLRADTDLEPNAFIFEYIGEVINEPVFRRRTIQYDEEGIKHFYFMSLTKSEFVDATKKGNLGRFCNHSCNPNCYVDKWVVGDKLRMGIFAERHIKAGEELVFNYNVDRYGADPQPCYCGEPNCTGFIGGKTQTERATKLSHTTIEALGIEDGDGWDTAVAKRPRKKKQGEDDEDYVNAVQPKGLDEGGVTKVMATLMQCKEKWIAVKLLNRIQRAEDDKVRNRVIRMHGYQVLRTILTTFQDDNNVVLQVLDILYKFPRLSKNKIEDAKIEPVIEPFTKSEHEDVAFESKRLLEEWSKLEVAYRIKRKKFDPNAQALNHFDRRGGERQEEVPASAPSPTVAIPTGPRNSIPQRIAPRPINRPPNMRRQFSALPSGWFAALDQHGNTYYYSKSGQTTWQRPNIPAVEPLQQQQKSTPKAVQEQKALQDIIDSLTKVDPTPKALGTPKPAEEKKEKKLEKWRLYPADKQMKIYENTVSQPIFDHILLI